MWGLFGVGGLLLFIAAFVDPVGSSPDTGVIALGPQGTRWFLGGLGALLLAAGCATALRRGRTGHG